MDETTEATTAVLTQFGKEFAKGVVIGAVAISAYWGVSRLTVAWMDRHADTEDLGEE